MKLVIIMDADQKFIESAGSVTGIFFCLKKKKNAYRTDSKREIQLMEKLWLSTWFCQMNWIKQA